MRDVTGAAAASTAPRPRGGQGNEALLLARARGFSDREEEGGGVQRSALDDVGVAIDVCEREGESVRNGLDRGGGVEERGEGRTPVELVGPLARQDLRDLLHVLVAAA